MEVAIKMLFERLSTFNPRLIANNEEGASIKGVKLYDESQTVFDPEYLYVGKTSHFPGMLHKTRMNLVCIVDSAIPSEIFDSKIANIILIERTCKLEAVFNFLQDIFTAVYQINNKSDEFFKALINGKGLQDILDIGYEIQKKPIVLFDMHNNLLAYSQNVIVEDPLWEEIVKYGHFSQQTLAFLSDMLNLTQITESYEYPFIFKSERLKCDRIIGAVYSDKKKIGTLVMVQNENPFDDKDIALCRQLCSIVSSEMQKNKFYPNYRGSAYENLVSDILDGKLSDQEEIRKSAERMGLISRSPLLLLAVDIRYYDRSFLTLTKVRDDLVQIFKDCPIIIYNNYILLILTINYTQDTHPASWQELLHYLTREKIFAGLSSSFTGLDKIFQAYLQSVKAIQLGIRDREKEFLYLYEDYKVYHLIEHAPHHELISFCHPLILEILKYDQYNNTEYLDTLEAYFANGKDSSSTAAALHLHRNTVLYRLEKVERLFKINMLDGNLLFHLFLSIKILHFIKIFKFPDRQGVIPW